MRAASRSFAVLSTIVAVAALAAAFRAGPLPWAANAGRTLAGPEVAVGSGTARMVVDLGLHGEPRAVAIVLTEAALTGLPTHMNTTSRCFDKNGDGKHTHGECLGDYQATLTMPAGTERLGLPVQWATVNWNPEGHLPPAPPVWSAAHFDFHFFVVEPGVIDGIRTGPCAEFIDCDDFATASVPLPAAYLPEGYVDVGAAVAAMGNHLVDSRDPELSDPTLGFSRTFIFGAYGGKLIFLEPMVSHAFLRSRPDQCTALRAPRAFAVAGYYPTSYCVRHDRVTTTYRISLEGLVFHEGAEVSIASP